MPRFNKDQLVSMFAEIMECAEKIETLEKEIEGTTGETRGAYAIVHKDFLWKIQKKIGNLWFCVCGFDDFNPFESTPPASE
jgi:hypothetical protein